MKRKILKTVTGMSLSLFLFSVSAEEKNALIGELQFKQSKIEIDKIVKNLPTQSVEIKTTEYPPSIDGLLDDRCWKDAAKIEGLKILGSRTLPMDNGITIYLTYNNDNIYVGFACEEKNMKNLQKNSLWIEGVEVFLDVNHDHKTAFHLGITPGGKTGQGTTVVPSLLSPSINISKWDGKMEAKTSCGENSWFAEIRIPFTSLETKKPDYGDIWGVCFTRSQFKDNYGSWPSLPGKHGFHAVEYYGDLYFTGNEGLQYIVEGISLNAPLGLGANCFRTKIKNLQDKTGKAVIKVASISPSGKKSDYSCAINLPVNQAGEFDLKFMLENLEKGHEIYFSIMDPDLKKEYYRAVYPVILPEKSFEISIPGKTFYLDENVIPVTLKAAFAVNLLKGSFIKIQLKNKECDKLLSESRIEDISSQTINFNLNIAGLPVGEYRLCTELINESGTRMGKAELVFEKIAGPFN